MNSVYNAKYDYNNYVLKLNLSGQLNLLDSLTYLDSFFTSSSKNLNWRQSNLMKWKEVS